MAFLPIEKSNNDIGKIEAFMRNTAPYGYLKCDGSIYNISDYPLLANTFKNEFGSYNYFGGNGTTTFAVPDLRGEFLRGTGTNGHSGQGSGANVGIHQNGTEQDSAINGTSNLITYKGPQRYINNYDVSKATANTLFLMTNMTTYSLGSNQVSNFIARPTNTSVLYCIKAY